MSGNPEAKSSRHSDASGLRSHRRAPLQIVIHALLDSPSVTGAYRFLVTPGSPTTIDVQMTLFPRRELPNVGIAPLTSMFLFSSINRVAYQRFSQCGARFRRSGCAQRMGRTLVAPSQQSASLADQQFRRRESERIWVDPTVAWVLGISGSGSHYEQRPSAWVERASLGVPGAIELFELPTEEEIHDNIVAYWKPAQALAARTVSHLQL